MAKKTATKCSYCGNDFSKEEAASPQLVGDNKPICDDCYHEHYEFTCCCCCNYGDVKDQHNLLVVFEECDSMGSPTRTIAPGVYRIKKGPYHGGPIIGGGYLYGENLERVADVNPDMDGDGYPCGHLCLDCQRKVLAQFAGKCSICKAESPTCLKVSLGSWKDFKAHKWQQTRAKIVCAACRNGHKGSWELRQK